VTVTPPARAPDGSVAAEGTPVEVERRWHAVEVLDRYASGDDPDGWRVAEPEFAAWALDVQRELSAAGRATTWLAIRHGLPVAKAVVLHDRQGLAVIEDVVVHPAHRRLGIASALTHRAVVHHLAEHPGSRIGIGAEPGGAADLLYRRLGFRPHAVVWTALRMPGS
jgi:GNAT superfamily N-acetyltransferase